MGFVSGFGPVENSGDRALVACVRNDGGAAYEPVLYSTLATHHPGCTATTRWGPDCNAAIHRYCRSRGWTTGFGPVENSGGNADVVCLRP